jgi:hypothetical protein
MMTGKGRGVAYHTFDGSNKVYSDSGVGTKLYLGILKYSFGISRPGEPMDW